MLEVEIANIVHMLAPILAYSIVFIFIWIIATIVNSFRWRRNISLYAAQNVQAKLTEQEQLLKDKDKQLRDNKDYIETLEMKLSRYKGILMKLNSDTVSMMELLNNDKII